MADSTDVKRNDNSLTCHVCGHRNLAGTLMCDNCGAMLTTEIRSNYGTRDLREAMPEFQQNTVFDTSGTGNFKDGMRLVLEIEEGGGRIELDPSRRDMVVGRRDPVSRRKPDVDLEDHEGYRHGVSRKHALFTLMNQQLSLQDYGSANGTYLNGVRLPAHQAHKVHDGDVMRLGHMAVRIFFVSDDEPDSESDKSE